MPEPSVVLVEVVRSGFVEGWHRGSLVVVDRDGDVLVSRGEVRSPMFPRSSNKLMQAAGMVELGYAERGELLALGAASHDGEPFHVDGVRRILAGASLDESALRTPPDWPLSGPARDDLVRVGEGPSPVLMNCSGKHAAMLATCVGQGFALDDYRSAGHPLQRHLRTTVERLAGEPVAAEGIDGCGAPVLAISLTALARAYSRAVTADVGEPERAVADAMRAHPEYVGGTRHLVTGLMRSVPGLLLKDGAEGVLAGALDDGRAFAIKVDDGADRPRPMLAAAILASLGVPAEAVAAYAGMPLLGGGRPVGEVRVAAGLLA